MKEKVEKFVQALIDLGKSFTAYDVTKILRASGEKVRHNKIRPLVHEIFDNDNMGIYHRTICTFPGIGSVNVFHQPYSDPDDYQSDWIDNYDVDDFLLSDNSDTSTGINDDADDDLSSVSSLTNQARTICLDPNAVPQKTFRTTKDGRLNIPSCVCKAVGFNSEVFVGQTTIAKPDGRMVRGLAIQPPVAVNQKNKRLHVDRDRRIRLNPKMLRSVFGNSNEFKITYDHDTVYIYQN